MTQKREIVKGCHVSAFADMDSLFLFSTPPSPLFNQRGGAEGGGVVL